MDPDRKVVLLSPITNPQITGKLLLHLDTQKPYLPSDLWVLEKLYMNRTVNLEEVTECSLLNQRHRIKCSLPNIPLNSSVHILRYSFVCRYTSMKNIVCTFPQPNWMCVGVSVYVCLCVYMWCVYAYMYMCVHVYVMCVYLCMCVYTCVYYV